MVNMVRERDKKGRSNNRTVRKSYVIYLNGSSRVVSFKLPEYAIYQLDKYSNMLGFKNRSDLLRLLIAAFLKSMEVLEKETSLKPSGVKISFIVESNDGVRVKQEIELGTTMPHIHGLTSFIEIEKAVSST